MSLIDLQALKDQLRSHGKLKTRSEIATLPGSGGIKFQSGQIIEVLGEPAYGWVMRLLKQAPSARVGWVSHEALDLCPLAVAQEKLALSRFLFLENVEKSEGFSKVMTFLRSGLFQVLVFDQVFFKMKTDVNLRKIQLLAEDHGVGLIMLSSSPTSSFGVQVQVDTRGGRAARFLKIKSKGM